MVNSSLRFAALLSALLHRIPGAQRVLGRCSGAKSTRYCYSVWLRHLVHAVEHTGITVPKMVAELGPGDSLGVGIAALLSGVDRYFAFDVASHARLESNLKVLDDLVTYFQRRAAIPAGEELALVKPELNAYQFPAHILSEEVLKHSLSPKRIERIQNSIRGCTNDDVLSYVVPWHDTDVLEPNSIDMILSQAVLEHVDDLSAAYRACYLWLKPGGLMSHQIDFKCHGTARHWNGHWTYSDPVWAFMRNSRPYLLNRKPYSTHYRLLQENGFEVVYEHRFTQPTQIRQKDLSPRFRSLTDQDLTTSGAFIQARKPKAMASVASA